MLSDRGIKRAMEDGSLVIDPFDERYLSPCSYDLEIERIYRVKGSEKPFVNPEDEKSVSMEQFIEDECEIYNGVLLPRESYIGVSKEKAWSAHYAEITTRSSAARLGIETRPLNMQEMTDPGHVYFTVRTFGTTCEEPEGRRLAQLFVHSGLLPLPEGVLRLGSTIKKYNGGILHPDRNNDGCFSEIDITTPYYLASGNFYLAYTEWLKMPDDHAGMLRKLPKHVLMGNVHPNSPLVAPGSEGNQVLEIYLAEGMYVKEGQPICEVEFWSLDQNPQNTYNGKYNGQRGPQTSLFHTE